MAVTLVNPFVVPLQPGGHFFKTCSQTAEAVQSAPSFISATLHQAIRSDAHFSFVNIALWEREGFYRAAFAAARFRRASSALKPTRPCIALCRSID